MRVTTTAATVAAAALLLGGCTTTSTPPAASVTTSTSPTTSEGTAPVTDPTSVDATSPMETITDLPHTADDINRVMYGRLVEQWKPVLAAFGEQPAQVKYAMSTAGTGSHGSVAHISVILAPRTMAEWDGVETKMAQVVHDQGWRGIGQLSMLNVRKGAYSLRGGCTNDNCSWDIESSLIPEEGIQDLNWQSKDVVELLPGGTATPTPSPTGP